MPNLIDRQWDKSKPPMGAFALNKSCPQAQGLVAWYPWGNQSSAAQCFDMVSRTHLTPSNAPTIRTGQYGEMVGNFVQASSQFFSNGVASPVGGMPLAITAWGNTDTSTQTVIWVGNGPVGTDFYRIVLVSGKVRANIGVAPATQSNAITTASYTAGIDQLFGATFTSATSRDVYLNGGNSVNDATNVSPAAPNSVAMGTLILLAGNIQFYAGKMGECGIWNIALSPQLHQRLYNPATRYELWYPLRSAKWFMDVPAVTTGKLFRPPLLNGLGAGGPFFNNPLG